ncbi:D-arabinose 1-dehydrogenase [NAD(P)+] activity protein [[Candida] boidinii]|nr:D-arabinose 1-dehydrogenase [NAD(P)+] activity protein [[Candida] boidinii]OWB79763.1 D-arabinose 1-dehydrogenase [NAD(P)+] activity protein [[Candida] boidinii]
MSESSALSKTIKLNTGAFIPAVGFGTVCNEENRSWFKDVVIAAIESGYRHIDTAWYYGTEEIIGEALQEVFAKGEIKREDLFVTTKVWPSFYKNPSKSLDESLTALKLDYVDLFLQHWPLGFASDDNGKPEVPKDANGDIIFAEDFDYLDTYKELIKIYKKTNKVKAIGVSNYTVEKLQRLLKETDVVPVTNQVELHPHIPQVDLVSFCKEKGIIVEAYSPLGSNGAPNLKIPEVVELAKKYECSPVDILVSYHVAAGRVVLPRSQNIERIKKGFKYIDLTAKELKALDDFGIANPKRFITDPWGKNLGFEYWD